MSYSLTGSVLSTGENPFKVFSDKTRRNSFQSHHKQERNEIKLCKSLFDIGDPSAAKIIITDMSNMFFGPAKVNCFWIINFIILKLGFAVKMPKIFC